MGSSVNKVLHLWPAHYKQFGKYVMKMSGKDRDTLQISGPKITWGKIDAVAKEKALQATGDEKVPLGQLSVRHGMNAEANSEAIDLSTFNAKADIKSALSLVEEPKATLKDPGLDRPARKIRKCLHMASKTLKSSWEHTQVASLSNAGIKYASIATVDVGARAVHSGLCTFRVRALRVGTSAQGHQPDVLAKYTNTIPLSNTSLFGRGLNTVAAKAASTAWDLYWSENIFLRIWPSHCPAPPPLSLWKGEAVTADCQERQRHFMCSSSGQFA